MKPKRIQRKPTKGFRMPANTVYVGRPTKWGNPWTLIGYYEAGYPGSSAVASAACVEMFRVWMTQSVSKWCGDVPTAPHEIGAEPPSVPDLAELRGKDLACWCPLDYPCHADVLLELANG